MSPCFLTWPGGRRRPPGFSCPSVGRGGPLQQDLERELLRAALSKQVDRPMQVDVDSPGKESRLAALVTDAAQLLEAPGDHRFCSRPAVLELLNSHLASFHTHLSRGSPPFRLI